jgi:hypothetical protein
MERDCNPPVMIRTAFLMSERQDDPSPDTIEVAFLVRQALAGDSAAFESIIRRYERRVVSLALKLLTRTEDAQDAAAGDISSNVQISSSSRSSKAD